MGSKKNKGKTQITKLNINGEVLTDNIEIANAMNSYFATIGEKLANNPTNEANGKFKSYLKNHCPKTMYLSPTSEEEVIKLIKELSPDKAAGSDGIHARTLKIAAPFIIEPLVHIFNQSILQATVPENLKISKVIPIYKKKERSLPGNYRPISLLSIFDKLLEKIIHKRLFTFLTENKILYDYQFGFRKKALNNPCYYRDC
jgi:hypothetical protein